MTTFKPAEKHYHSAKEHMAGVRAAAAHKQELIAAHLLRSQSPIRDTPFPLEVPKK